MAGAAQEWNGGNPCRDNSRTVRDRSECIHSPAPHVGSILRWILRFLRSPMWLSTSLLCGQPIIKHPHWIWDVYYSSKWKCQIDWWLYKYGERFWLSLSINLRVLLLCIISFAVEEFIFFSNSCNLWSIDQQHQRYLGSHSEGITSAQPLSAE